MFALWTVCALVVQQEFVVEAGGHGQVRADAAQGAAGGPDKVKRAFLQQAYAKHGPTEQHGRGTYGHSVGSDVIGVSHPGDVRTLPLSDLWELERRILKNYDVAHPSSRALPKWEQLPKPTWDKPTNLTKLGGSTDTCIGQFSLARQTRALGHATAAMSMVPTWATSPCADLDVKPHKEGREQKIFPRECYSLELDGEGHARHAAEGEQGKCFIQRHKPCAVTSPEACRPGTRCMYLVTRSIKSTDPWRDVKPHGHFCVDAVTSAQQKFNSRRELGKFSDQDTAFLKKLPEDWSERDVDDLLYAPVQDWSAEDGGS